MSRKKRGPGQQPGGQPAGEPVRQADMEEARKQDGQSHIDEVNKPQGST